MTAHARRGRAGLSYAYAAALAAALGFGLACTTATPSAVSAGSPCAGLHPPAAVRVVPLDVPPTYAAARLSAEIPAEVVVNPDGTVGEAAMRTAEYGMLAPFAEETLKRGRFSPGTFENNPAAVRLPVRVPIGAPRKPDEAHAAPEIWVYVAAGQSREARWQLRDSVSSVTVVGHVPKLAAPGGSVVAVAPDKQVRPLLTIPASDAPQEIRQTVSAGKVFAGAGEYRVELRGANGLALASARFTVSEDYRGAVINACETLALTRKTGPGN
jgi:hypothetical protein